MTFPAEYPGCRVWPAHETNYYLPENHPGGAPNRPRGLVLHTPQEPADSYAYTPVFFSDPNRNASTHYFASYTGDIYQMVPENCMAIANGVKGKPWPAWADPATSLNWQTLSIEIEGYAATIGQTCVRGGPQWTALVRWVYDRCRKYGIPLDRQHVIGHYEVADDRSDPGTLSLSAVVGDAIMLELSLELEDDCTMPVPWVRDAATFKSYFIIGGKKRHVADAAQEAALLKSGYIKRPEVMMSTAELGTIPDA